MRTTSPSLQQEVQQEAQTDFKVAAPVVHDDLEQRRRKFEEQQREAERVRQERIAKGECVLFGASAPSSPSPQSPARARGQGEACQRADAFQRERDRGVQEVRPPVCEGCLSHTLCRAMIERYEAQQRENAAILAAKKKSTQG